LVRAADYILKKRSFVKVFQFEARLWLPRPIKEVFAFFSDATNLEELTPSSLQFHILTPKPILIRQGTEIDYRLKIHGIPIRWRSKISAWDPPHRFVDEQLRGPYRQWIHEHRFTEHAGGTNCADTVKYAPIGGALINRLFVENEVRQIFAYRTLRLQALFPNSNS
jgi:ligand-binding SRPBCC domain-containing protein